MAFTQIAVTGSDLQLGDNTLIDGSLTFTPTTTMRNGSGTSESTVAGSFTVGVTGGTVGALTLSATDDPGTTPLNVMYKVEQRVNRQPGVRTYYLPVPYNGGPLDLNTATIVEDIPGAITVPVPGPAGPTGATGPTGPAGTLTDGSVTDVKVAVGAAISADKLADGTTNHVFTATDDTKLAGVATGATANATDAQLRDRTTHTGAQAQSTVTNLVTDLAAKAPLASPAFTGTPTGVTKTHVGLGNVDNTSDASKPVSTATQTALDAKARIPDVQVFTTSGTWTKLADATTVTIYLIAGGGGGGSGARQPSATATAGGAGGGGGGYNINTFRAVDLSATETVTVGTGGAGGAARTTDATNGAAGSVGGASSFGTTIKLRAVGGSGGGAGSTTAPTGGGGGLGSSNGVTGGAGALGAAGSNGNSAAAGGPSGAGGGGISATPTATAGGIGGGTSNLGSGVGSGTSGAAGGTAGGPGMATPMLSAASAGGGGGGGGASTTTAAGDGGAGGVYGGGGGGGGSSLNTFNSGAGGTGGAGIVVVISE